MDKSCYQIALTQHGHLSEKERQWIVKCRRSANRLGFCYQLIFLKIFNRLPQQKPFEKIADVLIFASLQIDISADRIREYQNKQSTISEHQKKLLTLYDIQRFEVAEIKSVEDFLYQEAKRFEQSSLLLNRVKQFLKEQRILQPGDSTLKKMVRKQRARARQFMFDQMAKGLSDEARITIDQMLLTPEGKPSSFQKLKDPPMAPSTKGFMALGDKIELIAAIGCPTWDMSWLHANYQRHMAKYAWRCTADRIRRLQKNHRYTVMVCFLVQTYQDALDQIIDMFLKQMTRIARQVKKEAEEQKRTKQKSFKESLLVLQNLGRAALDEKVPEPVFKKTLFRVLGIFVRKYTLRKTALDFTGLSYERSIYYWIKMPM